MADTKHTVDLFGSPIDHSTLSHQKYTGPKKIYDDAIEAIGNTPMVRLNKVPQSLGVKAEIVCKCEFTSIGGSVKDRMGFRMIEDAEKKGLIKPGDTIIENTSGNAGVAVALTSAIKGYNMIATIPERMSKEKVQVMEALGAKVIRYHPSGNHTIPENYNEIALTLQKETPNSLFLNQYFNVSNCLAHYDTLGEEILEQTDGKVDVFVAGMGTGGTLTGVGNKLKANIPNVKVIGVEPVGSVMADPENDKPKPFLVEGIGKPFLPDTCVRKIADKFYKANDKDSFEIAKRLVKEEGLLCGGSSGSAVWAAIQYALENNLTENDRIVVVLPDSIRNYLTKYMDENYMVEKGFESNEIYLNKESKLFGKQCSQLNLGNSRVCNLDLTVSEAFDLFEEGEEVLPIVADGAFKGAVFEGQFLESVETKKLNDKDTIKRALNTSCGIVDTNTDLSIVQKMFGTYSHVFCTKKEDGKVVSVSVIKPKHLTKFIKNQ